ncbi:hypothetical protein R6V09_50215, partial [Streptomyces sp. W16]|nr:hypothetical protein [Streptomyces sp. W16]
GELAGGASGILSTAQQFGGALGVAVIGNALFSHAASGLTDAIVHAGPWASGAYLLFAVLFLAATWAVLVRRCRQGVQAARSGR